ncbi:ketopantoate reductase family protein [Leuconostoc citreum]|uniref:ketopantoate reductase family protein n=1 Tax=Lactobacillales TaxID=186826 RepID=UPI000EE53D8D|nr:MULTISPECIES: 2-dehydropantoate 2-reductase N-terminal domain-containing protein [Lactobacillales]MCT3054747.1 ketopantoate reductase family protein [Leuconostoc citreum]MCT3062953.1 ketopantoate reductase family protein [Leuconostoc citreum]MCT3073731.1 ketopantoate reductase family protein [Leuconostoc citreum]HCM89201.1 hypothetical protein [Vagococcus sp.]
MDKVPKNKILIFGAGVIGSLLAIQFAKKGHEVYLYARRSRLKELSEKGLVYENNGQNYRENVHILNSIHAHQIFDYIFVAVRSKQMEDALEQLKHNKSSNIVILANHFGNYNKFEKIVGDNRIIPAFPGASGALKEGILKFVITPKMIQKTMIGEINGIKTERIKSLYYLLKSSGLPCSISKNMEGWQKTHIVLLAGLRSGIYFDGGDNYSTSKNIQALKLISTNLKKSFKILESNNLLVISPLIRICICVPSPIFLQILRKLLDSNFAAKAIYSKRQESREETLRLENEFLNWAKIHNLNS